MSQNIPTHFVDAFSSNVYYLSQQKGSKLRGTVRNETQHAESEFYDSFGQVSAVVKAGRHSNTPQMDTPHERRMVTMEDYEWADLIDKEDKLRTINDPTNDYVMLAMWALGRSMDDAIIEALGGTAYTGKKGTVQVALPDSQKYGANDGTNFTNLNVKTLRALKRKFDDADVDPSLKRYIACAPSQIEAMLGQTEVTSADYATVKALVQGEVNSFMGFEFVPMTRLKTQVSALNGNPATGAINTGATSVAGFRKAYAYVSDGALLAVGAEANGRISERDDKSYATQVYASMSIGATRMEEVKVIEVLCKEA